MRVRAARSSSGFDSVILGAGPSGLTAAYCLARDGAKVAVIERSPFVGGLMRGIRRGDFSFDVGRKELYSRFPDVHNLWSNLLGDDYRVYPHHVGLLYGGRLLEKTSGPQGKLRGMSTGQTARLGASFLWSQIRPGSRRAQNLEDYYLQRYGRAFYDYFVYGYTRKFEGSSPQVMPAPDGHSVIPRFSFLQNRMAQANGQLPGSTGRKADEIWRHPARGTGQIVEKLEQGARTAGAVFHLSTEVLAIPAEGGRARSVIIRQDGAEVELEADRLIGSLPMPLLLRLLRPEPPDDLRTPPKEEVAFKKSTALVYLMAEGAPSFPHNWLEVTDMSYKAGRIVNYATWNGDMVPPGKTGLCMEYFCIEGDGVMDLSNEDLLEVALDEAGRAGLIDRERVFDTLVIKLPHANAATVTTDWKVQWMLKAAAHVNSISHFYETNRPGMDRAALAGIDAAAACRTGEPMSQRSLCSPPDAV